MTAATKPSITVYCVPLCGHARAILDLMRRRGLSYHTRTLTPDAAGEVISAYHLYGSPVLVINGDVLMGQAAMMARIEDLAAAR